MASFIAKQLVGDQLKSVKGALGDKEGDEEKKEGAEAEAEEDPEIAEARREIEEKRHKKHVEMEEERENMRQTIRDKYGLKKKEPPPVMEEPDNSGRIGRKKKSPAEIAAEANPEEEDELSNSPFPTNFAELKTKVTELPGSVMSSVSEATEKCVLQ